MKIRSVIDTTIEYYFSKRNERQMMQALLYGTVLNLTQQEVAKEMNLSRKDVRLFINSIGHKRAENKTFADAHSITCKKVESFAVQHINKRHIKDVRGIVNRLVVKRNILIVKESKL